MKCLVMSLIVIVNMGINLAFATVPTNDFAYNSEPADSTGIETQYIYRKTDNGRYLRHHLKYRCTYDDAHRLLAREVLRWDANLQDYRPAYALHYAYAADATVTIECARWDAEEQAYTDLRERAVESDLRAQRAIPAPGRQMTGLLQTALYGDISALVRGYLRLHSQISLPVPADIPARGLLLQLISPAAFCSIPSNFLSTQTNV